MVCNIGCVVDLVLFIIWCISLPIYVLLIATLIKYRNSAFKSSFFKIFISLGVADVCSMIGVYAFVKALYVGIFNKFFMLNPALIAKTSLVWTWQCMFAQLNGVLLLTINRYVALVHVGSYEQVFTKERTNKFIAAQWVMAIVFVLPKTMIRISYKYQADNKTLGFDIGSSYIYYFQFATAYCFLLSVVTALLYLRMIVQVYKVRKQVAPATNNQATNLMREVRLAFVGLVQAVVLFFYGLRPYAASLEINGPLKLMYGIVANMFSELNPYILIVMCKSVRMHFIRFLTCSKTETSHHPSKNNNKQIAAK